MVIEWECDRAEFWYHGPKKDREKINFRGEGFEAIEALQGIADVPSKIRLVIWAPAEDREKLRSLAIPFLSYGADMQKKQRDDRLTQNQRKRELREGTGKGPDGFTEL